MGEVVVVAALAAAAAALLVGRTTLPRLAVVAASPAAGMGLFTLAGATALAVRDQVDLIPVVLAAVGMAAAGAVGWRPDPTPAVAASRWWAVPAGAGAAGAATWLAGVIPTTRLTPDSLDYLAITDVLLEPGVTNSLRFFDLETRNLTTALLHTPGSLDGRQFAPGITPAVVGLGMVFFGWVLWKVVGKDGVQSPAGGRRGAVAVGGAGLLAALTSGRAAYDVSYVNSHGPIMIAFLAAVAVPYLAVRLDRPDWLLLAGLACPLIMVGRPEGPLLTLIALAPGLTHPQIPLRHRMAAAIPAAITGLVWFGAVVWRSHPDQVHLSPLDPILGGVLLALALPVLALAPATRWERPARWVPWMLVVGLVAIVGSAVVGDRPLLEATLEATAVNLVGQGGWGVIWPVLLSLLVTAVSLPGVPHERLLLAPVLGFLSSVLAGAVLRGDPYRVGTGDSGNRMLAHGLLAVILYLVVSALHAPPTEEAAQRPPSSASRSNAV